MGKLLKDVSMVFSAGAFGGFVNAFLIWILGRWHITQAIGVKLVPDWKPEYIYPKVVWGGIWGLMFLLPYFTDSIIKRGVIFSLAPTAVVLFYILPVHLGKGPLGMELGRLLPLFALIVNAAWGIAAAWWLQVTH
ncbi:MAG: hypothetical protein COV74_10505 [Candidatus Omnitrophica bacterium CG11_big_fil_rev_8_21_14_0_20_45_26]|uniref:DUF1761 domain-containing protein n=1 Tax=Candidatus Abzuiibacterium crystallinum TaxID=1974748 RepID=A0A2H0LKR8_9BACT|nr:MAG: hypothetical protein COV74_10505 [Candidatus Omnitrophica bacterium CG11_big_fil_rev_8_21_14_0_20_45_26]PIW63903.1 MAG: hypothetical protein COW12_08310 [Candidatus Omnitrophica bacterium CG12_big_fil_rev_8_21_14_0_65_45_16]